MTAPRGAIRRGENRRDLVAREIGHRLAVESLDGDRERALNRREGARILQSRIAQKRPNGGETRVPRANGVVSRTLQVVEEGQDAGCVEVRERHGRGRLVKPLLAEAQEQSKGIPIAGDRLATDIALVEQVLSEISFEQQGKIGVARSCVGRCHCCPPLRSLTNRSNRALTVAISSGTAVTYQ